jgi:hypothetical protein
MLIRSATTTADEPGAAAAGLAAALDFAALGPPDFLALHFAATLPAEAMRVATLAELAPSALHGGTSCLGAMSGGGARVDGRAAGALAIWDAAGDYGTGAADLGDDPRAAARAATLAALAAAGRPGEAPELIWLTAAPGAEEAVLAGVCDVAGDDAAILGGSSADNEVAGDWAQLDAAAALRRGVVVSALFPSRPVACAFRNVHAPTDRCGVATRTDGRTLREIDGRPAAEVYRGWTGGAVVPAGGGATGSILAASTLAPLGREAEHLASVPFHLLAHPATVEADGSLGLFADVSEGETLWLMEGSADALASRAGAVVRQAIAELPDPGADIAGALVIYCGGCMLAVRERMDEVAADVSAALGGAPFLGVFSFGEQGAPLGGPARHGNLMLGCAVFAA